MFAKFLQDSFKGLSTSLFISEGVTKVEAVELFPFFLIWKLPRLSGQPV